MLLLQINDLNGGKDARRAMDQPGVDQRLRKGHRRVGAPMPLELEQGRLAEIGIEQQRIVAPRKLQHPPVGGNIAGLKRALRLQEHAVHHLAGGEVLKGDFGQEICHTASPDRRPTGHG